MKTGFLSTARRWAVALGMAAAVTAPTLSTQAVAAPYTPLAQVGVPAAPEAGVTQVRDRWDGRRGWRRGGWEGNRGWRRGGWDGGRRYYRHRNYRNSGAGLALGLGIGVPLGAYLASRPRYDYGPYGYYDDRYYVRRVPRPVYRNYGGNRHVNWCYNRYRSYRAYDNSFQPYNGPRQQCYSPFG